MSKSFRLALLGLVCGLLCMTQNALAAKPDYVVSLSSVAQAQSDILGAIAKIDPQSGMMAQVFLAPGGPIVPPGLGTKSPVGLAGLLGRDTPDNIIFGPCDNFKILKVWFESKKKDGSFPEEAIIVEKGKNFVIMRENTALDIPEDPTELLGSLPSKYLVAVRCTNPAALTESFVALAKNAPGAEADPEQIRKSLADMESIQLGWNVINGGDFLLNVVSVAKEGSQAAADLSKTVALKSFLSGFYRDDADAGLQVRAVLDEKARDVLKTQLAQVQDETAKALLESVFLGEKIDLAYSFSENDGQVEGIFACSLADGKAFLEALKDAIPEDSVKWNVGKIGKSFAIHKLSFPSGESCTLATNPKYVFLAVGMGDSEAALRATIQKTSKAPMRPEPFVGHLDAKMAGAIPSVPADLEKSGKVRSKATITGNTVNFALLIENDLIRTGFAIYKNAMSGSDDASGELEDGSDEGFESDEDE
ncbi:MAG: hypothetical protein Q4D98_09305 [Planctomycetia bacterium]|nr:hypothetical protein [Planctomycetia bacterium]